MIVQILFTLFLYVCGLSPLLVWRKTTGMFFLCISAFLWGSLMWVIGALLCAIFAIPVSLAGMAVWMIAVSSIGFAAGWRLAGAVTAGEARAMGAGALAAAGLSAIFFGWKLVLVTSDSFNQLFFSHAFVLDPQVLRLAVNDWPPFLILLHSGAPLLGEDYIAAIAPGFFFSLLALLGFLGDRLFLSSARTLVRGMFAGAALLCLISIPMFRQHAVYIHNNLLNATFLLAAVGSLLLAQKERSSAWLAAGMLALLGVGLTRTEGVIFVTVFLLLAFMEHERSPGDFSKGAIPLLAALFLWELCLLFWSRSSTSMIVNSKITLIYLALLLAAMALVLASRFSWMQRLLRMGPVLMFLACVCLLVVLWLFWPETMQVVDASIRYNLFLKGGWGGFWYLALLLVGLTVFLPPDAGRNWLPVGMFVYFTVILAVGWERGMNGLPLSVGEFDSANRMLLSLVPLFILYLLGRYSGLPGKSAPAGRES